MSHLPSGRGAAAMLTLTVIGLAVTAAAADPRARADNTRATQTPPLAVAMAGRPRPPARGGPVRARLTIIDSTNVGGIRVGRPTAKVAHNHRSWQRLWAAHTARLSPTPPTPRVDLMRGSVVAYIDGPHPGPVSVTGLRRLGPTHWRLDVRKLDTSHCPRIQLLENPAVIVRAAVQITGRVSIRRTVSAADCAPGS